MAGGRHDAVQCDEDFPLGAIKIDRVIGQGAFGRVHAARYGSVTVAVKFLNDEDVDDESGALESIPSMEPASFRDSELARNLSAFKLGCSDESGSAVFLKRVRSGLSSLPTLSKTRRDARKSLAADKTPTSAFGNEISIMSNLNHPNIASYYGVGRGLDRPALVMEYARHGSLADVVSSSTIESLDWSTRIDYMRQVACGLEYMHSRSDPVQHCDLRAENVLITSSNVAKICDFGLAKVYSPRSANEPCADEPCAELTPRSFESMFVLRRGKPNSGKTAAERSVSGKRGSAAYLAPEVVNERPGTPEQAEVYALGVLAWFVAHCNVGVALEEMQEREGSESAGADESYFARAYARMFGRSSASHQFAQVVCFKEIEGYQLRVGSHVPAKLAEIISQCTAEDPDDRPSFAEMLVRLSA